MHKAKHLFYALVSFRLDQTANLLPYPPFALLLLATALIVGDEDHFRLRTWRTAKKGPDIGVAMAGTLASSLP